MEGRIRSLLLGCLYLLTPGYSTLVSAEDIELDQVEKPLVQPEIERMNFEEANVNPNNFEIIASFGILSIEDFSVNAVVGAKLIYRVSENFFTDVEFGVSTAGESSIEVFLPGSPILSVDERDLSYYTINIGYDLFPSESFVTDNITINTAFYTVIGAGNTTFAGSDNFTFSFGFGYRAVINHYITGYFDVRDHTFELDIFGVSKRTQNIEMSFGLGFYF